MKGDFSRDTFDPLNNFSRVLLQQGRVQLDADFNEQASILLYMLRRLTADIVGSYAIAGGPDAFRVAVEGNAANRRLVAGGGRAYVGGYLVEVADGELAFPGELEPNGAYVVFLDVWERHVTYHETAAPIREVALGGPDTATRAQVVCRLRALDRFIDRDGEVIEVDSNLRCELLHARWPTEWPAPGLMAARTTETRSDEACVVPSDSRYRGLENQLYRVEIHRGGNAAEATFKWSRDNGSVVFPLAAPIRQTDKLLTLVHLGRDERFGLRPGDWVEIVNDDTSLNERFDEPPAALNQVVAVDPLERTVTLAGEMGVNMELATVSRVMRMEPTMLWSINSRALVLIRWMLGSLPRSGSQSGPICQPGTSVLWRMVSDASGPSTCKPRPTSNSPSSVTRPPAQPSMLSASGCDVLKSSRRRMGRWALAARSCNVWPRRAKRMTNSST